MGREDFSSARPRAAKFFSSGPPEEVIERDLGIAPDRLPDDKRR
jgi:hypothetical protein